MPYSSGSDLGFDKAMLNRQLRQANIIFDIGFFEYAVAVAVYCLWAEAEFYRDFWCVVTHDDHQGDLHFPV